MTEPNDATPTDLVAGSQGPVDAGDAAANGAITEPLEAQDGTEADQPEFEGPRRRARRERAERRGPSNSG